MGGDSTTQSAIPGSGVIIDALSARTAPSLTTLSAPVAAPEYVPRRFATLAGNWMRTPPCTLGMTVPAGRFWKVIEALPLYPDATSVHTTFAPAGGRADVVQPPSCADPVTPPSWGPALALEGGLRWNRIRKARRQRSPLQAPGSQRWLRRDDEA